MESLNDAKTAIPNDYFYCHDCTTASTSPNCEVQELVHDAQNLQLCAVHTVNNLLQLTANGNARTFVNDHRHPRASDKSDGEQNLVSQLLIQGKLCNVDEEQIKSLRRYATKNEFDMIADSLAHREQLLLLDCNNQYIHNMNSVEMEAEKSLSSSKPKKMSFWNTLKSNHRTPISGNYSFEVLQTALLNRNVDLKWFDTRSCNMNTCTKNKTPLKYDKKEKVLLGYIINEKIPASMLAPHRYFFESRHWYTITRVRWVNLIQKGKENNNEEDSRNSVASNIHNKNIHALGNTKWFMVDSSMKEIHEFDTESDVEIYLKELNERDCNIFQALLQV